MPILIAGFIGSVISLTIFRNMSSFWAFIAVLTGTGCAIYLTPIAAKYVDMGKGEEDALAFIFGAIGMNILLAVRRIAHCVYPVRKTNQKSSKNNGEAK